jgi:hypothetical protein
MQEQIKLYSVLKHDTGFMKKPRKKISQKERKERGDFILPKAKDQVKKIVDGIDNK